MDAASRGRLPAFWDIREQCVPVCKPVPACPFLEIRPNGFGIFEYGSSSTVPGIPGAVFLSARPMASSLRTPEIIYRPLGVAR